jgi:hypothetical protein
MIAFVSLAMVTFPVSHFGIVKRRSLIRSLQHNQIGACNGGLDFIASLQGFSCAFFMKLEIKTHLCEDVIEGQSLLIALEEDKFHTKACQEH